MGTTTSRARWRRAAATASALAVVLLAASGCTLYGWGSGGAGDLGNGFWGDHASPVPVARNPDWTSVDAGTFQSCGIDEASALWCWGSNEAGQLGIGTYGGDRDTPARVGTDSDWTQVSAGGSHVCGIRTGGSLSCWGWNYHLALGVGTGSDRTSPTPVDGSGWTDVTAGGQHTCGIRTGELWCWGDNQFGAVGIWLNPYSAVPTRIGTASDWTNVEAGDATTCGIRAPGSLWCWGHNAAGQVGDGTNGDKLVPTQIGTATDWMAIAPGDTHTCGIRQVTGTSAGRLWCWGDNDDGELGDGTKVDRPAPVSVGTATDWRTVSTGTFVSCGIRATWLGYCWGDNKWGMLGTGAAPAEDSPTPKQLGGDDWGFISVGYEHVLGARNIAG